MSLFSNKSPRISAASDPVGNQITGLHNFVGTWHLNRKILQPNGDEFVFKGKADFTWLENRLLYQEDGVVTVPNGAELQAERTYFWQMGNNHQFDVYFADNRYFHSFSGATPQAEHLCGTDHYKVNYTFDRWPLWESSWQVKGPRKDYTMRNWYQPG